jgi:hypothetical protein
MSLTGTQLTSFAASIGSRLGISVSGTAASMASRLGSYITSNPMSTGFIIASLADANIELDLNKIIDMWNGEEGHEIPEEIKYLLEQVIENSENRQEVTGDQDEDTVMGIDKLDLRKAAQVLAYGDTQVETLMRHFGSVEEVIAVRTALLAVDDEQLILYRERHNARRY